MAKSIMDIKDPDLRNTVWRFEQSVKRKVAKKNWQPPPKKPRTFREHCLENGRPDQAEESARLIRKRLGERED